MYCTTLCAGKNSTSRTNPSGRDFWFLRTCTSHRISSFNTLHSGHQEIFLAIVHIQYSLVPRPVWSNFSNRCGNETTVYKVLLACLATQNYTRVVSYCTVTVLHVTSILTNRYGIPCSTMSSLYTSLIPRPSPAGGGNSLGMRVLIVLLYTGSFSSCHAGQERVWVFCAVSFLVLRYSCKKTKSFRLHIDLWLSGTRADCLAPHVLSSGQHTLRAAGRLWEQQHHPWIKWVEPQSQEAVVQVFEWYRYRI